MSEPPRDDDSIADKLDDTCWDYSQSDDRRFLLDPIGPIFGTFCWDGRPPRPTATRLPREAETPRNDE